MMKAKSMLGAVTAALLTAGSVATYGEPCGPQGMQGDRPHGGPGGGPMAMSEGRHGPMGRPPMGFDLERAKQAGATDAQIQTLSDFQLEQQIHRIDLQAAVDKADLKLATLMKAQKADEKDVLKAVDAINQARGELFKLDISSMLKAKQVLGEAVLKKLHEMAPPPGMGPGMPGPRGGDRKPGDRNQDHGPAPELK